MAAFADPGAEQGVGTAVDVDEPGEGYAHMTATDASGMMCGLITQSA